MHSTGSVGNYFNLAYEIGRKQVLENRRFVAIAVSSAFALLAVVYRRLHGPDILPFDRWYVSLGLWSRTSSTETLDAAGKKYPPAELARRFFYNQQKTAQGASDILPAYQQGCPITLEEQEAYAIRTWATSLQPLFAFIKDKSLPWKELVQPIQSSPRLAYTILFNCMAPFAAQAIWDGARDFLPKFVQETGNNYLQHKGKIALASLALITWLYYRMNQEKGILTNWTQNLSCSPGAHRGLDLIPSYEEGIKNLFHRINISGPGSTAPNIIWYYNEHTHSTFVGAIGQILGEMTATGRAGSRSEVIEFDLQLFLTEYRNVEDVYRGWHDILKKLGKSSDTLVVLTGIDAIKPYLIPRVNIQRPDEGPPNNLNISCEKLLTSLILLALKQRKFRCLIELSEDDLTRMKESSDAACLFSDIRAPDVNAQELEKLCSRLYTASEVVGSFTREEIHNLFVHMAPALAKKPIPPSKIMNTIQDALRERLSKSEETGAIRQAKQHLYEAQKMKEAMLQKIWRQRRRQEKVSSVLLQGLSLIENKLLPLYKQSLVALQGLSSQPPNLVSQAQEQFGRMFGQATAEEEARLRQLPENLKKKIKGQDAAIQAACLAIHQWRAVPPCNGKPLVLFFAGAPGVGKSQMATDIAHELNSVYGIVKTTAINYESNVRRINLNRKAQGAVFGWDKVKESILSPLLHAPSTVIILEEWDKMDDGEKSGLLELLDSTQNYLQGYWNDNSTNGPFVDKSCAIFILTANIATGDAAEVAQQRVREGISNCFSEGNGAPFLSRLDAVIPFAGISPQATGDLVSMDLNRYEEQGVLRPGKRSEVEAQLKDIKTQDAREVQRLVQQAIFAVQKEESKE